MPEGERLIAFEAAIEELAKLQSVAARYVSLRPAAEGLLGELMDLGRTLRQATRRSVFTDELGEECASRVRRLREEWHRRLADLRSSDPYRQALEAYAADDQPGLGEVLPALFADLRRDGVPAPFFQPIALTTHRRAGGSPFRSPAAVADDIDALGREGLRPRLHARDWWDTDLAALSFVTELADIDAPAALSIDRMPASTAVFREADSVVVFTPRLEVKCSVVLAESSTDAWYEAAEGSYEEYRGALARALEHRGIEVRVAPAWS